MLIFDIVRHCADHFPDKQIFHAKREGKWLGISATQFAELVDRLSLVFLSEGVAKGECVATIFCNNSYEWNIIDMALSQIGAVHLPVYPTISDSDYHFILTEAEVRWVFITDQLLFNKISQLRHELPLLRVIVSIEKLPSVDYFYDLIALELSEPQKLRGKLETIRAGLLPEDVCTILYTSGTTGFPKGVMLTHQNLCTNVEAAAKSQPLGRGDRVLSFLPLCHIYQRTAVYQFILKGVEVWYAENLKALLQNMKEVKPNGTTVVPRVLEKIIAGMSDRARSAGFLKRLFLHWSIHLGFKYEIRNKKSLIGRWKLFVADKLVYHYVRAVLGGHIRYVGCGGAPIDERILRFFWAAGIPVYEGYGLTESSPLVAVNTPGDNNIRIGTVGPPIEKVEVRIAEDGEILVRGPNVMKGYFKDKELTDEVLKEGWLHTGDLGKLEEGRFVKIIGRKKEMFKTSYGKYIVPQAIESRFLESRFIEYLIVIGEGRHYAAAIISPNFNLARRLLLPDFKGTNAEVIEQPEVREAINKEIKQVNRQLGQTEQIKKHLIVEDAWSIESGEISATQKLRRNIIQHKYEARIRDLYREDNVTEI